MQPQSLTLPVRRHPEFAGIVRDEEPFADANGEQLSNVLNERFDRLVMQSGVEMPPSLLLWCCLCSSAALGLALFVMVESPLWTAVGLMLGGLLPICWTDRCRARRRTRILAQLPEVIGRLTRLLRAGRSLNESFRLVAADAPQPLGPEIEACVARQQFGLPLAAALSDLPQRTGVAEIHQLVAAATVHQRTGANPIPVLDRLAAVLRARGVQEQQRNATRRLTRGVAAVLVATPWVMTAALAALDPGFLALQSWGWWVLGTVVGLQVAGIVGILWIARASTDVVAQAH